MLLVSDLSVSLTQIAIEIGVACESDRPQDPLDREPGVSGLHGKDAGQVECVSIIRLMLKHFAIKPVRFTKAPLLMVGERFFQSIGNQEFRRVLQSLLSSSYKSNYLSASG